jgi:hypothetical protein
LTDQDIAKLAEAAIGVLAPEDADGADLQSMPPSVIQYEIAAASASLGLTADEATRLAEAAAREDLAPGLAQTVVTELRRDEALAGEIAEAYERRKDLMAVDPLTISAAALLLLVLRVRRVRISKQEGVDVTLDPLKADVVKAVLSFVGGPR